MKIIDKNSSHLRAKHRIARIKSFYSHLAVFILVNIFISSIKIVSSMNDGANFLESISEFETFKVWLYWGIGLVVHAFSVFGLPLFLVKIGKRIRYSNLWMKNQRID